MDYELVDCTGKSNETIINAGEFARRQFRRCLSFIKTQHQSAACQAYVTQNINSSSAKPKNSSRNVRKEKEGREKEGKGEEGRAKERGK